jgi:hypothetical protein
MVTCVHYAINRAKGLTDEQGKSGRKFALHSEDVWNAQCRGLLEPLLRPFMTLKEGDNYSGLKEGCSGPAPINPWFANSHLEWYPNVTLDIPFSYSKPNSGCNCLCYKFGKKVLKGEGEQLLMRWQNPGQNPGVDSGPSGAGVDSGTYSSRVGDHEESGERAERPDANDKTNTDAVISRANDAVVYSQDVPMDGRAAIYNRRLIPASIKVTAGKHPASKAAAQGAGQSASANREHQYSRTHRILREMMTR